MAWAPMAIQAGMTLIQGIMAGDEESMKKFQTLDPQQKKFLMGELNTLQKMQGQNGAMGQGMNILQQYLDPNSNIYKNFEKPYMQEFEQQTVPGLAERFAGAGANGGALSSSGFGQALSSAGANLQTNLAQMKSGLQRNAINDIFGQYNNMANRSQNTAPFGYQQKGANPWTSALASGGAGMMNAGMQGMFGGQGGVGGGGGYQTKFPLTSTYDSMFRSGAWS